MPTEKSWHQVVEEVVDNMVQRENEEVAQMIAEMPEMIEDALAMNNWELLDYFEQISMRGFSNPQKAVAWQQLRNAVRAELQERLGA